MIASDVFVIEYSAFQLIPIVNVEYDFSNIKVSIFLLLACHFTCWLTSFDFLEFIGLV